MARHIEMRCDGCGRIRNLDTNATSMAGCPWCGATTSSGRITFTPTEDGSDLHIGGLVETDPRGGVST